VTNLIPNYNDAAAAGSRLTPAVKTEVEVVANAAVAPMVHAVTNKVTPVTADELLLLDSVAAYVAKRITFGQLATAVIAQVVASAPSTLDTLNELATALGNDPNFATTMTTALAGKQPLHAILTALAGLTLANNKGIYATGTNTFAPFDLTAAARTLLDDADTAAMRLTLSGTSSIPTSAGTTTSVVSDSSLVFYTGTTTHIHKLPTTGVFQWDRRLIVNDSTGIVTVQSSGANAIVALPPNTFAWFSARQNTPTIAAHWHFTTPIWKGTQAQYTNLGSYDNGVIYVVDGLRVVTVTPSATPTINGDITDVAVISPMTAAITAMAISGTPKAEQKVLVKFKDNGTARAITHGGSFVGDLLATTVASKWHRQLYVYDLDALKWVGLAYTSAGY